MAGRNQRDEGAWLVRRCGDQPPVKRRRLCVNEYNKNPARSIATYRLLLRLG
jgi:hypothetical protein